MHESIKKQILERSARKFRSIASLEKKAGVSEGIVRNIVLGYSKNPTISTLVSIAKALECSVSDLLHEDSTLEDLNSHKKWENGLFKEVLSLVDSSCLNKNVSLSSFDMLFLVKEVYYYSLNKNENKIDRSFAEGLIDGYIKKSCKYPFSQKERV